MSNFFEKLLMVLMATAYLLFGVSATLGALAMFFRPGSKDIADVLYFAVVCWMFMTATKAGGEP